jgi:sigma-E factor negative regulatory protein RseA
MTDPMLPNEALQSQLSAFVDDALPTAETDLFARRLVKDAELKHTMARYGLIGEALRAPNTQAHLSRDFSARVAAALDQQQPNTNPAVQPQSTGALAARWLKPVAGLAIAASVAWVAVLTVQTPTVTPTSTVAVEAGCCYWR